MCSKIKWEVHLHHSLKLALHLLDPNNEQRLDALKAELLEASR